MAGNKNSGPGKGRTNNPKGMPKGTKHKRTEQWEQLGDFITKSGAERAVKVLKSLPDDEFLDQYNKLLNYFKPKISYNINSETKELPDSVTFKVKK